MARLLSVNVGLPRDIAWKGRSRWQRRRQSAAERLSGFEIDDELKFSRVLHRQINRLLALEDATDVASGAPVGINRISPIGDQATTGDE
jgi:hypothetical protein